MLKYNDLDALLLLKADKRFKPTRLRKWLSKTIPILTLASLVLTGCNDGGFETLIEKVKKPDSDQSASFCQSHPVPFAYTLCEVSQNSLVEEDSGLSLQLFWKSGKSPTTDASVAIEDQDRSREPLYKFDTLLADLTKNNELKFAVNAGMYNSEFAPIGYTVLQGRQILSLNLNEGAGNFHLMPNGVLWWDKANHVYVTESVKFNKMLKEGVAHPWYASQSGPMLVIDNQIHPKFNSNSTSVKMRNGVGVCDDGKIKFVNSSEPVNFYEFASLFKDDLKCPNALFLDGGIASALYAPDINLKDDKNMGVMVGLVENSDKIKRSE